MTTMTGTIMTGTILTGNLWIITLLVLISMSSGKPVTDDRVNDSNLLNSHDVIATRMVGSAKQSRGTENAFGLREKREKRDIINYNETPQIRVNETSSNETSFEDYEKEYLINMTMNLLKEFLHYDNYLKHLKEENSSVRKQTSTHNPAVSVDPVMPTALPHSGDTTKPDDARMNTRLLQEKMSELNQLDVSQLTRVFNNLHQAAEKGVEDPGITSLCCNIG